MGEVIEDYRLAAATLQSLVDEVGEADWARSALRPAFTIRDLVNHVVAGHVFLGAMARGEQPPAWTADHVGDDPPAALGAATEGLVRMAAAPGDLFRKVPTPLGEQAFMFIVVILTNELWLHAWQLSRVLDVSLDPPLAACVLTSLAAAQTWKLTEPGLLDWGSLRG